MPNWDLIAGTWRQWRGQALNWWTRLTDAEWEELDGNRERLIELLELKYGWTREQAVADLETRFTSFPDSLTSDEG